ncbi:MAG: ABC transporter substrate-binding protein [Burkholderiales bacterium]|nr:ABC transporter substrate-binding protein [Burkholderiales bacterium]MBS0403198.1 ABC transporter substrate-binding protein [Pseudomonadota bacterium]MBS0415013.1 ABC transporter substrate-binding protein [Pseudomonadota bacterium]
MSPTQRPHWPSLPAALALAVGLAVSPPLCAQSDVPAAVTPRAAVPAQAPPRVVAYLGLGPSESVKLCMNEVRDELEKSGWSFDGQVRLEWNDVANDPSRYASAAQAMVARRPDVLLATDNPPTEALMNATKELPIVVMGPTNIGKVLDAQLRPLANVTGVSLGLKGQFAIKPMEMLLRAFPQARRIGMISNRDNIGHERAQGLGLFADMLQQADVEGLRVRFSGKDDIARAWDELARLGVDAVLIWPDSSVFLGEHAQQALRVRLPAISHSSWFATRHGGLLSYGSIGRVSMCGRGARYVNQILRGRPLAELPVEELYEAALVVNLDTAERIGVTLPSALIERADRLIRPGERTLAPTADAHLPAAR